MQNEKVVNPVTQYLRFEKGMTLKGWATINKLSYGMTSHVVNGGMYSELIVQKLRDQGLYSKLPRLVREKIEDKEHERLNAKPGKAQQ